MFQAEDLDRLPPPEDALAFNRPVASTGQTCDPVVVRSVVSDTAGCPFFSQL
jgi:hypothetical protein